MPNRLTLTFPARGDVPEMEFTLTSGDIDGDTDPARARIEEAMLAPDSFYISEEMT